MDLKHNTRTLEIGTRIVLVVLFAAGCFLWGRSSEQTDTDQLAQDVDRQMTQGEFSKLYTALKTHFPKDYTAERDGLVRLTRANAGPDDFAVFLRLSQDQLETRHVEDFAAAGSAALARFRVAEIAWKEALHRQSPEYCRSASDEDLTPGDGMRNSKAVPAEIGDMDYAMVMAMADGRVAKIRRGAPTPDAYAALYRAMAEQGIAPDDVDVAGRGERAPGRSPEAQCVLELRTLKAIHSLPAEQADLFTVLAFRNAANSRRADGTAI